jgi:transcriptional regulator with XRE-family HTH domain
MSGSHNRKKTSVRIKFGRLVREKRYDANLTQETLAERANMHPTQGTGNQNNFLSFIKGIYNLYCQ